MSDNRRWKRWQLIFYLRVFDKQTQQLLGHVVDITTNGMMLISDKPLPIDKEYFVMLDIPDEEGGRRTVSLRTHSLWSKRDVNPDFFDTGFRLVDPTPEAVHHIRLLIDDLRLYE